MIPAAFLMLLAGCSKNENAGGDTQEGPVPVRLNSGILEVTTRSVVDAGSTFTASVAGWETEGTVDYAAPAAWTNTPTITASTSTPGSAVTLSPARYYNADDNVKTYIKGWHPAGTLSDGKVTFENTDGTVDAMITEAVVGSKVDAEGKNLVFGHLTTQLKFMVKTGEGVAEGTTIRSITIKDAELPAGFDLTDNGVTYKSAADLFVPNLTETAIPTTAASVGDPVMIKPFSGNTVRLDIQTSEASFTDVTATIDDDANFLPGKAYTITLTFQQKEVELTATVTAWDNTGTGSATIE